jgi:predicted nuclease with TOPRIM domain
MAGWRVSMRNLALLLLVVLSLSVAATLCTSAEELPTIHGYLGYDLYFRIDAPIEAKVNSTVAITLTLRVYDDDIYVYKIFVMIYGCGVNTSSTLFSETWLGKDSQYTYLFTVTPREEGYLRFVIMAHYYFVYQNYNYYQYGSVATNITAVRAITYVELKNMYDKLRADYESLLANYTELKKSYEQLQLRYSELLSNYTTLLGLYRDLNESYRNLVAQYSELASKHSQLLSLCNDISARYRELVSQYEKLLSEYNALRGDYNALLSNYTSLATSYGSLVASYNALKGDYSNLSVSYSSLESSYQKLRGDYESLAKSYSELSSKYSELVSKYAMLESRYGELLDKYRELGEEHKTLQATITERTRVLETLLYVVIALGVVAVALATVFLRKKVVKG